MALAALGLYAVVYGVSLAALAHAPGFQAGEALGVMLVFGLGFSALAWLATLAAKPPALALKSAGREMAVLAVYLGVFGVGFLGLGLSWLEAMVRSEPLRSCIVLAAKLTAMVVLPGWLFTCLGYSWRELLAPRPLARGDRIALVVMGALLLALQLTLGRGPKTPAALQQPTWLVWVLAPPALLWLTLEAGLTEEFLFRALLQARAAAWLRSETAGIVAMALAFALAHAPGYVLRGAHAMEGMTQAPDALTAAAYAVVVVSPVGLMFGVLWARTRHLWLLVELHGWADLLPNLAPFVQTWVGR